MCVFLLFKYLKQVQSVLCVFSHIIYIYTVSLFTSLLLLSFIPLTFSPSTSPLQARRSHPPPLLSFFHPFLYTLSFIVFALHTPLSLFLFIFRLPNVPSPHQYTLIDSQPLTHTDHSVPPACRSVTDWLLPRRLGIVDVRNWTGTPDHRAHQEDWCLSLSLPLSVSHFLSASPSLWRVSSHPHWPRMSTVKDFKAFSSQNVYFYLSVFCCGMKWLMNWWLLIRCQCLSMCEWGRGAFGEMFDQNEMITMFKLCYCNHRDTTEVWKDFCEATPYQ